MLFNNFFLVETVGILTKTVDEQTFLDFLPLNFQRLCQHDYKHSEGFVISSDQNQRTNYRQRQRLDCTSTSSAMKSKGDITREDHTAWAILKVYKLFFFVIDKIEILGRQFLVI